MKVIGIDPGSRVAGFAVIEKHDGSGYLPRDYKIRDAGVFKFSPKGSWAERLLQASNAIFQLTEQWQPQVCVLERAFFGENVKTAIQLGEVRGAMISAAGRAGASIGEITPAEVKKIIAGNGRAKKEEVAHALCALYKLDVGELPFDVTDAIAIALSYAINNSTNNIDTKRSIT